MISGTYSNHLYFSFGIITPASLLQMRRNRRYIPAIHDWSTIIAISDDRLDGDLTGNNGRSYIFSNGFLEKPLLLCYITLHGEREYLNKMFIWR